MTDVRRRLRGHAPRAASLIASLASVLWAAGCATLPPPVVSSSSAPVAAPAVQPPLSAPPPSTAPSATPGDKPPLVIRIPPPPPGGYPKSIAEAGSSPAVQALVRQAQTAKASGKPDAAIGALERALRIEPRNPWVWQALADAKLAAGGAADAEAAAHKASALARGNPWLDAGNWRLIAAARAALGDGAGARLANDRADGLNAALAQAQ